MSKIGIALGGGGVRGLAHALALEAVDEAGVNPSVISGTSIGGIIGALYASGESGREIRERLEHHFVSSEDQIGDLYEKRESLLQWLQAVRPSWDNSGLISANRFLDYLLPDLKDRRFADLEIPLRVVATDFHRGDPVVFGQGNLSPALQASMSIPGVFVPVKDGGRLLVDGGVVNNLPYDLLPDDCDIKIAIDIVPVRDWNDGEEKDPGLVEMTLGAFDIMLKRITTEKLEHSPPDIYVPFEFHGIRALDFRKVDQVWEQCASAIDEMKQKLDSIREN